jgi:hypothetical protein
MRSILLTRFLLLRIDLSPVFPAVSLVSSLSRHRKAMTFHVSNVMMVPEATDRVQQ